LGVIAGTAQAEDTGIGYLLKGWSKIDKATMRLKGRLLGSLIQEGMTADEVGRILGDQWSDYAAGTIHVYTCGSTQSGISILFSLSFTENPPTGRVRKVSFGSLFD
jgi:hypothetical protein